MEDKLGYEVKLPRKLELNQAKGQGHGICVGRLTYDSPINNLCHGPAGTDRWCTNDSDSCTIALHGQQVPLNISGIYIEKRELIAWVTPHVQERLARASSEFKIIKQGVHFLFDDLELA